MLCRADFLARLQVLLHFNWNIAHILPRPSTHSKSFGGSHIGPEIQEERIIFVASPTMPRCTTPESIHRRRFYRLTGFGPALIGTICSSCTE
ncbi:hypothetical protein BPAE_0006g01330 [Botrytis paeoniae]|uniref:Uncharacterized protein n=1 Tax=Botrytis paeoniae TaxID=278948 RepID=A0A4Z1G093_9HELO|nr:hypothetical protein BPAE_0006g01330 [Botrytis paeoniae]